MNFVIIVISIFLITKIIYMQPPRNKLAAKVTTGKKTRFQLAKVFTTYGKNKACFV